MRKSIFQANPGSVKIAFKNTRNGVFYDFKPILFPNFALHFAKKQVSARKNRAK
jgi:hypothetical protein